jgi:hypothetical protein
VAARESAPLGVFCEERDERFGIAPIHRLGRCAKLLDHGEIMAPWDENGRVTVCGMLKVEAA